MKAAYNAIYLSPHLDDAALSCGGRIYQSTSRGDTVLVVTLMAGEPDATSQSAFVRYLHEEWGLTGPEATAARRAEDVAACTRLGAAHDHWSFLDAIYRLDPQTGAPLYTSDADIFGNVAAVESDLISTLASRMANLPPAATVFAPLTVGRHVDHQLVRQAAERVWGEQLVYYEDYPYVQRTPEALSRLLLPRHGWREETVALSADAFSARLEAIATYRTQLKVLFESREAMTRNLAAQVAATGGERYWRRVSGAATSAR